MKRLNKNKKRRIAIDILYEASNRIINTNCFSCSSIRISASQIAHIEGLDGWESLDVLTHVQDLFKKCFKPRNRSMHHIWWGSHPLDRDARVFALLLLIEIIKGNEDLSSYGYDKNKNK